MKTSITKEVTFDSAHQLVDLKGSKCQNMHGHTYRLQVTVTGAVKGDVPMIMDFAVLKTVIADVVDQLDHKVLNTVFNHRNPTAEFMAVWLLDQIEAKLPADVHVSRIALWETPTSFVELEV